MGAELLHYLFAIPLLPGPRVGGSAPQETESQYKQGSLHRSFFRYCLSSGSPEPTSEFKFAGQHLREQPLRYGREMFTYESVTVSWWTTKVFDRSHLSQSKVIRS